jgi:hypothetical protein
VVIVLFVTATWTVIKQRYDSQLIREIRAMGGRADTEPVVSLIWQGEAVEAPRNSFAQRLRESTSKWFQTRDEAVCDVNLNGCQFDPKWLPRLTRATDLEGLSLDDTHLGPELAALQQNAKLKWLSLSGPDISRSLRHVSQLSQLESVSIWGDQDATTELASRDLGTLVDLLKLRRLNLSNVSITDEGLEQIGRISSLEELHLWGNSESTPDGLRHLSSLGELRELSLQRLPIGDQGLASIRGLSKLKTLYIICPVEADGDTPSRKIELPPVTDVGLEQLRDLTQLEHLCLESECLSDDCIVHLVKFPQLKRLTLFNSQISQQGLARLKDALPKCKIRIEEQ